MQNIIETLQMDGRFNQFLRAVFSTNFMEIFEGKGPFTVFAPTDDSFENMPDDVLIELLKDEDKLLRIVSEHTVIGHYAEKDLEDWDEVKNMDNRLLAIERHDEGLIIGGAKITEGDILCSNGIIHAVDLVLMP